MTVIVIVESGLFLKRKYNEGGKPVVSRTGRSANMGITCSLDKLWASILVGSTL